MATHPARYNIFEPGESSNHTHHTTTPASSLYTISSRSSSNHSPASESPPFPPPAPRDPYTTPPSAAYTLPAPPAARPRAVAGPAVRYPRRVATAAGGSRYLRLREEEDGDDGDSDAGDGWTWRAEGRIAKWNGRTAILTVPVPKVKPEYEVLAEYQGLRLCGVCDAVPWLLSPLSLPTRLQAILEDGLRFPAPLCHPAHRYTHTRRDKALLALLAALEGRRERGNWYVQGLAVRGERLVLYKGDGGGVLRPLGVDLAVLGVWAEEWAEKMKGEGVVEEGCGEALGSGGESSTGPARPPHLQHVRPEDAEEVQLTQFPRPERSVWRRETPARTEEGRTVEHEPAPTRWCAGLKNMSRTCLLWTSVGVVCLVIVGGIIWGFIGVMVKRD